jgi:hypothetical protein
MKREVEVTQVISVEIDESKFDETFLKEFREFFYPFHEVEDHYHHLAQLYARGIVGSRKNDFIEGYGPAPEMGIVFGELGCDTHLLPLERKHAATAERW